MKKRNVIMKNEMFPQAEDSLLSENKLIKVLAAFSFHHSLRASPRARPRVHDPACASPLTPTCRASASSRSARPGSARRSQRKD